MNKKITGDDNKKCILVTGMHRSGTSSVAGALSTLGFTTGDNPMPPNEFNEKGYFEDIDVSALNDKILDYYGRKWDSIYPFKIEKNNLFKTEIQSIFNEKFGNSSVNILKDPRFSLTFPIWQSALSELGISFYVVLVFRDPLEVYSSLKTRNKFSLIKSFLLWGNYSLNAEADTRNSVNRVFVHYDKFLTEPEFYIEKILDLTSIDKKLDKSDLKKINDFLDPSLRHFKGAEVKDINKLPWLLETYEQIGKDVEPKSEIFDQAKKKMDELLTGYYPNDIAETVYSDVSHTSCSLFINSGNGYSEQQKIFEPFSYRNKNFIVQFQSLESFGEIQSLRWDPVENKVIKLFTDSIIITYSNGRVRNVNREDCKVNGIIKSDGSIEFQTLDPWIEIPVDSVISKVTISGRLRLLNARSTFRDLNDELVQQRTENQEFRVTIDNQTSELSRVLTLNNQLLANVNNLTSQVNAMKEEVERFVKDEASYNSKLNKQIEEIKRLRDAESQLQVKVKQLDTIMVKSLKRESDLKEELSTRDIGLAKSLQRASDLEEKLNARENVLINSAKDLLFYRGLYKTTPLSAHKRSFKKILFKLDRFFETRTYIPNSILLNPYVFDPVYYQKTNPHLNNDSKLATKHWLDKGVFEGLPSSQFFHVKFYLNANKDLKKYFGRDYKGAIQHWVDFGIKEQRIASPSRERINISSNYDQGIEYLLADLRQEKKLGTNRKIVNQNSNNNSPGDLVIFIAGESMKKPGYKYRVERYAQAVKRLNYQTICIPINKVAEHLNDCKKAKLILIWRAAWSSEVAKLFNLTEQLNIPTVFDVDDLMVRPELATSNVIDAIRYDNKDESAVKKLYSNVAKTMKSCTYNTAATHELAWHMRKVGPKKPTFVLPNGYSSKTYSLSRVHARIKEKSDDGLVRIGYASGGLTHQKDFRQCAKAVAQILSEHENVRLVLFKDDRRVSLDISEFPSIKNVEHKVEWRPFAAHDLLPKEVARFDINIAPLEYGNEFCESKSELKYFEAAIANVPTIASPTGPFKRAIKHKQTGFLASNENEWLECLRALVLDSNYRKEIGRTAHRHVLWPFGPSRRVELAYSLLEQTKGKRNSTRSFYYNENEYFREVPPISIEKYEIVFEADKNKESRVTVIIPLFNYEDYVEEALESVKSQTVPDIDLIVVDDKSTDGSQEIVHKWMNANKERFNRVVLVQHKQNQGLGASRNTAFDLADTLYVMTLDADNTLLSECCEECFNAIESESAAFAYSTIQQFGDSEKLMGNRNFNPADFIPNSGIDAMAMISKEAWSLVGGYTTHRMGWQDYDFWCRIVDRGLHGVHVPKILAKYRVHQKSMLRTSTDKANNKLELIDWMESEHSWLSLTTSERKGHHITPKLSD